MRLHRTATIIAIVACSAGSIAACSAGREVHRHQMKVWMDGPEAEVVMACTWPIEDSPFDDGCLDLTAGAYEGANTWWVSAFSSAWLPWRWADAPAMETLFVACQRSRPVGMSLIGRSQDHIREVQLLADTAAASGNASPDFSSDEARELAASMCDGRMGGDEQG